MTPLLRLWWLWTLSALSQWSTLGGLWIWDGQRTSKRALMTHHEMIWNIIVPWYCTPGTHHENAERGSFPEMILQDQTRSPYLEILIVGVLMCLLCCYNTRQPWAGALSTSMTATCLYLSHRWSWLSHERQRDNVLESVLYPINTPQYSVCDILRRMQDLK